MYLAINILGVIIYLATAFIFSKDKKNINWRSIVIVLVINLLLAWVLTSFALGRDIVKGAADGFNWLVQVSYQGIAFALPNWVHVKQMNFIASALLPILMIVPMFDILTYIGILPWIIKWVGRGLAYITGQPKFESFFAVEMMFLGNTEALAVSKLQLTQMRKERGLTLALMSMSCVTASILGAYTQMVPGQFVLTAVPLNILNAVIVTSLLNPVTVTPEEDTIAKMGGSGSADGAAVEVGAEDASGKREQFVVMGQIAPIINTHAFSDHYRAVLTVFLTSFANFSTTGMIIGAFKGMVDREKNDLISKNVGYMLLSGILVSLLSAGIVGIFVW